MSFTNFTKFLSANSSLSEKPDFCSYPYAYLKCTGKPKSYNKFYPWRVQNYTGTWESNSKYCPLKILGEPDLKTCFPDKNKIIAIDGDSVSRQFYYVIKLYLNQRFTGFADSGRSTRNLTLTSNSESRPDIIWYRNSGLRGDYKVDVRYIQKIKTQENRTIPIDIYGINNTSVLILGPKFLHPVGQKYKGLKALLEKAVDDGNVTEVLKKSENIHRIFLRNELPKIKKYLSDNEDSWVYLVGQHLVHRDSYTIYFAEMVRVYNRFIKRMVEEVGNPRFKFVDIMEQLGMTPEEDTVLTPDGTHWMWTKQGRLPVASSHIGFLKTLFSHYCFYRKNNKEKSS